MKKTLKEICNQYLDSTNDQYSYGDTGRIIARACLVLQEALIQIEGSIVLWGRSDGEMKAKHFAQAAIKEAEEIAGGK